MTNPAILEALARAIHCHDGRLPTPWDADMIARWPDDCEYERKIAMSQAAAVLELPEVRALKDERDAATAAYWRVRSYAVHDDDCTINRYPNRNACSCGLTAALAALKEPKT